MTREENLALYERLVATNPDIEREGATMPCTSANGHMFSLLSKEGGIATTAASTTATTSKFRPPLFRVT